MYVSYCTIDNNKSKRNETTQFLFEEVVNSMLTNVTIGFFLFVVRKTCGWYVMAVIGVFKIF